MYSCRWMILVNTHILKIILLSNWRYTRADFHRPAASKNVFIYSARPPARPCPQPIHFYAAQARPGPGRGPSSPCATLFLIIKFAKRTRTPKPILRNQNQLILPNPVLFAPRWFIVHLYALEEVSREIHWPFALTLPHSGWWLAHLWGPESPLLEEHQVFLDNVAHEIGRENESRTRLLGEEPVRRLKHKQLAEQLE